MENLQQQGIVVYVKADMEISRARLDARNANLFSQGNVWKNKAKDVFIAEDFMSLSQRYEKEMLPGLEKMKIPYIVVENDGTLEECIEKIWEKLSE